MRDDVADEALRFEDLDKAALARIERKAPYVLKQSEEQAHAPLFDSLETFRQWLELQTPERIADVVEAIGDQLIKSRVTRSVGWYLHHNADYLRELIEEP